MAASSSTSALSASSSSPQSINIGGLSMTPKQLTIGGIAGAAAVMMYALDKTYFISKDIGYIKRMYAVKAGLEQHLKANSTTADFWEETVRKYPKKTAIIFEGKEWSYDALDKLANRVANFLQSRGVKRGDVVCLLMENRAEYVPMWMGVLKLGGIASLINFNIRGKPLLHSLTISGGKILITGIEQIDCVREIYPQLAEQKWTTFCLGGGFDVAPSLDAELAKVSDKTPPRKVRDGCTFSDSALLVYTSGTTGLPKAATIKHLRFYSMGFGFMKMYGVLHDDRILTVLPLYHSAGGLVGVGMMMHAGATMILTRKFSASQFWPICKEYKVTVVQYIGELCRYLLGVAPAPTDKQTTVRVAIGNGLRPDIWAQFQSRFNIPEIGEFYGSTEGNAALMNHSKDKASQGAVGRMGPLLYKASKLKLVRFDIAREEPIRNKEGFCIECATGETGELLGEIVDTDPLRGFAGYHGNKDATSKKVIRDVFLKGDSYFRTGDLLKRDKNGYWYFVDRIGDTFRWKGENVSTLEVAEAVSTFPGIEEVNVYGVEVPHQEGRGCCASMVAADSVDWAGLYAHASKQLPSYAMPLFIRKLPKIEVTGTFKHQKVDLRNQGIVPSKCLSEGKRDALLIIDPRNKTYRPFTESDYNKMLAEKPTGEFGAPAQDGESSSKKKPAPTSTSSSSSSSSSTKPLVSKL